MILPKFILNVGARDIFFSISRRNKCYTTFVKDSRKQLLPFVKMVHPDIYASESETIQKVNMHCLQSLNELWDCIEFNVMKCLGTKKIDDVSNSRKIVLAQKFKNEYNVSFYRRLFKSQGASEEKVKVEIVHYEAKIVVPKLLLGSTDVQFTEKRFTVCLKLLLQQHGKLYRLADLQDTWTSGSTTSDNDDVTDERIKPGSVPSKQGLYTAIFERLVQRQRFSQASKGSGELNQILSREKRDRDLYSGYYAKGKKEKIIMADQLAIERRIVEVANFLQNNVMVNDSVPAHLQMKAMEHLRMFLLKSGGILNFHVETWQNVFFILVTHNDCKESNKSQSKRNIFKYELKENNFHAVYIPLDFKARALRDFLFEELPNTSIPVDFV